MGVGLGVGDALGDGDALGVGVGVGAATGLAIATPLLQISFFPLLTHVNSRPAEELTWPCFLQAVPALTAPDTGEKFKVNAKQPVNSAT